MLDGTAVWDEALRRDILEKARPAPMVPREDGEHLKELWKHLLWEVRMWRPNAPWNEELAGFFDVAPRTIDNWIARIPEFAAAVSQVLGKPVEYKTITADEERAGLTAAGLPAEVVEMLASMNASIAEGALSLVTGDLSTLLGRPVTPIADTLASWV